MPIEFKIYGCKYKCSKKHNKNKKWITEHEEKCYYNPENKTCITCKNAEYFKGSSETRNWNGTFDPPEEPLRTCKLGNGYLSSVQKSAIDCAYNCPYWEK